jgi:E3 ubiquitin-protein ligase HUWE1
LGAPVDYSDLEALEPDYYNSLKQILELPMDALGLELAFSAETLTFGKHEIIDLIPGGRNIPVTEENKMDYVQLVAQHRMTTGIRSQIEAFLRGFYELVPPELISIFSPTELELLISGLPEVDIGELRMSTDYHQYRVTDDCITWFWEVLKEFNREEKALFLLFVTGTSKVTNVFKCFISHEAK